MRGVKAPLKELLMGKKSAKQVAHDEAKKKGLEGQPKIDFIKERIAKAKTKK